MTAISTQDCSGGHGAHQFPETWEGAIRILRRDPQHQKLIYDSYLTDDIAGNCRRFAASAEFAEVLRLITLYRSGAHSVLDIPGGNGIATFAFAKNEFIVTSVEPDPSDSVGRGAIHAALASQNLSATVVEAFGEALPFEPASFDVVYVRQGLHHAQDLQRMLSEYFRVLRPGALLIATREHVVDDYGDSLKRFLDSQADHQLYGGENAYTLPDYRKAIASAGFALLEELAPYDSPINLHPNTIESLGDRIVATSAGRLLSLFLPRSAVVGLGIWQLRRAKVPGRAYSFVAQKPE